MIRATIACDGEWPRPGESCRNAIPAGAVTSGAHARRIAARDGWSAEVRAFSRPDTPVRDLCPACTRRARETAR